MSCRFRHAFGILFFFLVASCSGGGCSAGCGGCAGTAPLPGGFPKGKTIANGAAVRVSRPGLDFLESALPTIATKILAAPGGVAGFDIPNVDPDPMLVASPVGPLQVDPNVCAGGPDPTATPPRCHAAIGIGSSTFQIDAVTPNAIKVRATLPLELDDTPIAISASYQDLGLGLTVTLDPVTLHVGYGDGSCSGGKPQVTAHVLPIGITIPLVEETSPPRNGYTKIDLGNATIDLSALNANDIHICANCAFAADICSAITDSNLVKGLILGPLKSGLEGQVKGLLADQLCVAPNGALNPPCPTGTSPNASNKQCVFKSDITKCVSTLLGTDAHMTLDGALKDLSPATMGGIDFVLAAGGSMMPFPNAGANAQGRTPNGISLGMLGGVVPQPASKCVPQASLEVPAGIAFPDELAPTANDPATTPHLGIALAGRFLEYALGSVYNSGLLCLGVSSEQVDVLRSGLLSLIVPSLKTFTFEQADAAAAIATRPQAPPTLRIGAGTETDALLNITLPKFALDFYLWHLDRFVRVFTFEADLTVPLNLQTARDPVTNPDGGLLPSIGDIKVVNATVTNSDLLADDPALVATALAGLLGGIGKQLGGALSPINLSSALKSFGLAIDVGRIAKLTKGSDDFVGIFANLSKAAGPATVEADTTAVLVSKKVPVEHMQLGSMDRAHLPELVVDVSSPLEDRRHAIEYSWWIDSGSRSQWSPEKHLVLRDGQLLLQGRHILRVSARVVGEAATEDATPANLPFTIDAVAPFVRLDTRTKSSVQVTAWDLVSADAALVGRYRLDAAEFGSFRPLSELARLDVGSASRIDVDVRDEEGNVRSVSAELRGRADGSLAAAGSGCGCSTVGMPVAHSPSNAASGSRFAAAALGLAGLVFIAFRRQRQRT